MNHLTDGIHRTARVIDNMEKHFTVRLDMSPNTSERVIAEEGAKTLFKAFKEHRDPDKEQLNLRIECLLHSYATMFDLGSFSSKKNALQRELAKKGMGKPPISTRHEKSHVLEIVFNVTFFEKEHQDPFYKKPVWDIYRTE